MKKIIPLIFFVLVLSSSAFGIYWYPGIAYYDFDNNFNDTGNLNYSYKLVGNYSGFNLSFSPGMGSAINFSRANKTYVYNSTFLNASDIRTIEIWFNIGEENQNNDMYFTISDATTNKRFQIYNGGDDNLYYSFYLNGIQVNGLDIVNTVNEWNHFIYILYNTSEHHVYLNGNLQHTYNVSNYFSSDMDMITVGGTSLSGTVYGSNSTIDNIYFSNRIYTSSDVTSAYNSGAGQNYSNYEGGLIGHDSYINGTDFRNYSVYLQSYNITSQFNISDIDGDLNSIDIYINNTLFQQIAGLSASNYNLNFTYNVSNILLNTSQPISLNLFLTDATSSSNYTYLFNVLNYSLAFESLIFEIDNQKSSLIINTTHLEVGADNINITAKFYSNGEKDLLEYQENTSTYNYFNISTSFITDYLNYTQNRTSYYEITLYDRDGSSNFNLFNITFNQTVYSMNLTDCTGITNVNRTLDIFLLDEIYNTNITGNLQVNFDVAHNNLSRRENISMNLTSKSIFNICIYPNWIAYNISSTMTYLADNYGYRNYYLNNLAINNLSQNLFLYLINTTSSENIFIYIRDENDDPLRDYRVEALRYYPDENIYRTVQVEQTDYNGLVLMKLIPYTVFYKFIVKDQDGNIIGQTEARLITQSTFYLRFNLEGDPVQQMEDINNIAFTLTWDNATGSYTYTYSDASGITRDGCLLVEKLTTYSGKVQQCYTCNSGTSGTLICTLGGNLSGSYTAFALINTTTNHSLVTVDILTKTFANAPKIFGLAGVFLALILIGTVSAFGMWNPSVAIGLCLVTLIISVVMGLVFMSITSLVGIVIVGVFIIIKQRT